MEGDDFSVELSGMKVNIDPSDINDLVDMIMDYDPDILNVLGIVWIVT